MLTAHTPPPPAPPPPGPFFWECDGCEVREVTRTPVLPEGWLLLPAPIPAERKTLCYNCGQHFSADGDL